MTQLTWCKPPSSIVCGKSPSDFSGIRSLSGLPRFSCFPPFLLFPTSFWFSACREILRILMQFLFSFSVCQPFLPLQAGSEPSPQGQVEETPVSNERDDEPARHIFSFSWLNSLTEWWLTPAGFWCASPRKDHKRPQPGCSQQRNCPGKGHPRGFCSQELSWPPCCTQPLRWQSWEGWGHGDKLLCCIVLRVFFNNFLFPRGKQHHFSCRLSTASVLLLTFWHVPV